MCGGGGGSCQLRSGTSYPQTYLDGYQQVLSLPAGAKNVRLEEVAQSNDTAVLASNSFIAVAAQNGGSPSATPVLNWNYRVQWPGKQKKICCQFGKRALFPSLPQAPTQWPANKLSTFAIP